ncbi:MAG: hypothetical protein ACFFCX_12305 [Candidatus Sifarchaeia archaeon]
MTVRNRVTNLKAARKGLVIVLLLVASMILPAITNTYLNIELESIHPQYIPCAEIPTLNLSYTTRTSLIDTPVKSGDVIAGDHVTLKAEWTPTLVNRSKLEVRAPAIPTTLVVEANESTIEIDTRALGNNATCIIIATTWLANGSMITFEFGDVYIGNYFIPKVTVITPNGEEDWTSVHNITWSVTDVNLDDEFLYDVFYSSDSGSSFIPLVYETNQTWFEWDCSSLNRTDTYIVRVRVTDGIYFTTDNSDSTFTAGTIITTTTTPPTTTPTTTMPGIEPRIVMFIAILLFSSGIMALVVYIAAKKWF